MPVRVTIGKKSMADGNVEIKLRAEPKAKKVAIEKAADTIVEIVTELKAKLNVGS